MAITLADERFHHGAMFQDENERYFLWRSGEKVYGYRVDTVGAYVCFTCGFNCRCS